MLDVTMQTIQAALGGLMARQRVIAENVANADTPGYLAGRVSFEDNLRSAVSEGAPSAMHVSTSRSTEAPKVNGNNVQIDDENVSLIETTLRYQLMVDAMNTKFRILQNSMRREI